MTPASFGYPRRFGRYVLMTPVGVGEMATVALALGRRQGREQLCVIKQVRREVLAEPATRARVQRETSIARRLSHAAIARTFDDGVEQGAPYLVGEFVHGWTLSRLLSSCSDLQRWPSIALGCHIVREVARALDYLHDIDDAGIVHRDVAPPNIMLSFAGEVKLIDFGIAKAVGDAKKSDATTVVGRYTYGAPEIFHGSADARSDLYGLAVILWSLLAQRSDPAPFLRDRRGPGNDEQATIESPPAPSIFNQDVPRGLEAVVGRALSFLPEDRYQSAEELEAEVASFIPLGFDGPGELRAFFRKHAGPEEMAEAVTDDMLARARAMLPDDEPSDVDDQADAGAVASARPGRSRIALLALGFAAVAGVGLSVVHREPRRPPSAQPTTRREPPAAVVRPPLPSPAALTGELAPAIVPATAAAAVPVVTPARVRVARQPKVLVRPRTAEAGAAPSPDPAILMAAARESYERGDFTTALQLSRQAVRAGAGAEGLVLVGRVLMVQGDLRGAEGAFSAALERQPSDDRARELLARARELLARR